MKDFIVRCISSGIAGFTPQKEYSVVNGFLYNNEDYGYGCGDFDKAELSELNRYMRAVAKAEFELVEESKMFTKADLKSGMIVTLRNGNNAFVMLDTGVMDSDFLVYGDGSRILHLEEYANDLTYSAVTYPQKAYDIVKVEQDTYCLGLLQKCGYSKKSVFDREKGIGCKPEHKFSTGDAVKAFDIGNMYSTYDTFVEMVAPQYKKSFIIGGHPHGDEVFKVVAHREHPNENGDYLYVVLDETTCQVFIFGEDGLEKA